MNQNKAKPLDGMRVIEMGQLIAGPFTGSVLAYYGAEVIKIEPPTGDPVRYWRLTENNTSYWWGRRGAGGSLSGRLFSSDSRRDQEWRLL